jgi:hypothetical protein
VGRQAVRYVTKQLAHQLVVQQTFRHLAQRFGELASGLRWEIMRPEVKYVGRLAHQLVVQPTFRHLALRFGEVASGLDWKTVRPVVKYVSRLVHQLVVHPTFRHLSQQVGQGVDQSQLLPQAPVFPQLVYQQLFGEMASGLDWKTVKPVVKYVGRLMYQLVVYPTF